MSRNLCTDRCPRCGHGPVMLADLSGKPIEFRAYADTPPKIGARWDCPGCNTAYFAMYLTRGDCITCKIMKIRQPATWEIDLSYWASFNDEEYNDLLGLGKPRHLITEGQEHQRFPLSDPPQEVAQP